MRKQPSPCSRKQGERLLKTKMLDPTASEPVDFTSGKTEA
jgi:hypothetical protein